MTSPADKAWLALVVGILVYEIAAPAGELMSEGMDRYRARHPWLATSAIVITAAHLLRLMPARLDPYRLLERRHGE